MKKKEINQKLTTGLGPAWELNGTREQIAGRQ
jgi:hypothetical protein